ncbi:MAG: hypothetical protein JW993_20005 [Sedimentisphaerales bacterium]|nr:hypothetical protein [Sedimentisphaerales bacterium]
MTDKIRFLLALTAPLLVLRAAQAQAADPPQAQTIHTVKLQVGPAPEPRYALQYRFETPYMEQRPGDGALLYQMAIAQSLETNSGALALDGDTLRQWYDSPIEELPLEEVRAAIGRFQQTFHFLGLAAESETCTWEYPAREEGFQYMTPQLVQYRTLFRLLALKARLEVHDDDFEAALKTLRTGYCMARDVGAGPSMIQHLVGLSIAAGITDQVEALIQKPGAPNLYWALTVLPDPPIDPRAAMEMESAVLYRELPELLTLEDKALSNAQATELWQKAIALAGLDWRGSGQWMEKTWLTVKLMKQYPQAKAHLRERGYPADKVESWAPLYVVLLDQHHEFRRVRDMCFKWAYVPYTQAAEGLKQAEREVSRLWEDAGPFAAALPAMYRVGFLRTRLARDIAILRCVEAIRMYAADHDGKLPGALADITKVPVPTDPLRGAPFHYELTGDTTILESPIPPDGGPRDGLRYEITLK